MSEEARIYQRIGEFAVSFQWIENKLREIGWFIQDPDRKEWPPNGLRNLTNEKLIDTVHQLFNEAIPKCELRAELEADFIASFSSTVGTLHQLRRDRNRILHSAFIELKAGGEIQGLLRSNPKIQLDEETGQPLFDQELLSPDSFENEMKAIGESAIFLNRAYLQLIARYPHGSKTAQQLSASHD